MKPTQKDIILDVLLFNLYQTPEKLLERIKAKYGKTWKVSNLERRLRELQAIGLVSGKAYKNETNPGKHKRWIKEK